MKAFDIRASRGLEVGIASLDDAEEAELEKGVG